MRKNLFETILSFLLGSSWAVLVMGAVFIFQTFHEISLSYSIIFSIVYVFIVLFFILILEMMNIYRDSYDEKRKQTKLLYDIRELLKKNAK